VELYVQALGRAPAGTMLHAVTDEITLGDLAAAVSRLVGAGGRTEPLSLMEMYARGGGGGVSLKSSNRKRWCVGIGLASVPIGGGNHDREAAGRLFHRKFASSFAR
jgi:hypothetical protein